LAIVSRIAADPPAGLIDKNGQSQIRWVFTCSREVCCMWLRTATLAFALCSCVSLPRAAASTAETIYYIGEASTTGADGSADHPTYLVARTSDQSAETIAESVVTFTRGAYAEDSSVIKVDGNRISMRTAGGIEGKGELTGKPWEWTFLRLEFD